MTLIVKLCNNNLVNFLIIILFFGILSKNFADDQRSATVSKNAPNATTNAFSDLPQKTQNWIRYLSVSTSDSSVFKQVNSVAGDASSSWVLVDGYDLRQLPYSFPQENRPGYIHYRGTNNPDAECKQYQPQFSGIAGFIGGSGTQNNDYTWNVTTTGHHEIYLATFIPSASSGTLVQDPRNQNIYLHNADGKSFAVAIDFLETGHSSWKAKTSSNKIPINRQEYNDKWVGLYPGPSFSEAAIVGSLYYSGKRNLLRQIVNDGDVTFNRLFCEGKFQNNDSDQQTSHVYNIDADKVVSVLNYTHTLREGCNTKTVDYDILLFNCTDACLAATNAAGVNIPSMKRQIGIIYGNNQEVVFPYNVSCPAALVDYLLSLVN